MKIHTIHAPLAGEQLLVIQPTPRPEAVAAGWRRRSHLYTGRALGETALRVEQAHRGGHLALLGQTLAPGVVAGLEADLESRDGESFVHLGAGLALAASGEDIRLAAPLRVALRAIPVVGQGGETLGELLDRGVELPPVLIPLLEPVVVERIGEFDATDPCERDPRDGAFEDWQRVDAARLVLYAWPTARLALPAPGPRWRNRLAAAVFAAEQSLGEGELLPWESLGVGLGLIGFEQPAYTPLFLDRHSVVRQGGGPRTRSTLPAGRGKTRLWRARMQQFNEHLAGLIPGTALDLAGAREFLAGSRGEFRYLPPVGLLPREAVGRVDDSLENVFFPASYRVEALPVPLEQLQLALEASLGLAPLDLYLADRVEILFPVPQAHFHPDLLETPTVAGAFLQAVDDFVQTRGLWLRRRLNLRTKASLLQAAIGGEPLSFPDPDPQALEDDETLVAADDPAIDEADYGTEVMLDDNGNPRPGPGGEPERRVVAVATLRHDLTADSPLTAAEVAELDNGLEAFIASMQGKIARANDRIDLGFVRAQTDIYRLRQLMLGTTAATRLATSPALASIAQGQVASATREDLSRFMENLQSAAPAGEIAGVALRASAEGSGGGGGTSTRAAPGDLFVSGEFAAIDESRAGVIGGATGPALAPGELALSTDAQRVRDQTRGEVLPLATAARPETVLEQQPIVGATFDFRATTVGERLQPPPAGYARDASVAGKHEVISGFLDLDINVADLEVAGAAPADSEERPTFGSIDNERLGAILAGEYDRPAQEDEAGFFSAGVKAVENGITTLRRVEGRVQAYRRALGQAREVLGELQTLRRQLDRRLQPVAEGLAEARHDVSVARALLAEETARVAAIRDQRQRILDEQVSFLAFRRARLAGAPAALPHRALDPDLTAVPEPPCLREALPEAPPELADMLALLRAAPLRWFRLAPRLLGEFTRLVDLRELLQSARLRSAAPLTLAPASPAGSGLLAQGIGQTLSARQQGLNQHRARVARLDLGGLTALGWQDIRARASETLSLADIIDEQRRGIAAARLATAELDAIRRVATCMYLRFGEVLPAIRLAWAERLSQFDAPANLRNLQSLPRWGEIPLLLRHELQFLGDWLYDRVEARESEAVALIHDLLRVCILLASHAPVKRIIAGRVVRPSRVAVGARVDLAVDPGRVTVGMRVMLYAGQAVAAEAVVEDLAGGEARARVLRAPVGELTLAADARAHFTLEPGA